MGIILADEDRLDIERLLSRAGIAGSMTTSNMSVTTLYYLDIWRGSAHLRGMREAIVSNHEFDLFLDLMISVTISLILGHAPATSTSASGDNSAHKGRGSSSSLSPRHRPEPGFSHLQPASLS